MKKKFLISLFACFIAAGSLIHFNLVENISSWDVSLADIAIMAKAFGEDPPLDCGNPTYIPNETLRHKMCIPMIWENYLACVDEENVCCDPSAQTTCSWN